MNLFDIPVDVLLEIFRWVDGETLYTCLLVSKSLHAFLKTHPEFEYAHRLEEKGLVDTSDGGYPYEKRIRRLKDFTSSWEVSTVERTPTQIYHIGGDCIAYELVGGVFAKTDGTSLTVQWLPFSAGPTQQLIRSPTELLIPIKDFALDPTQDLIVMIEADELPRVLHNGRTAKLHLRTLLTNLPHPAARRPIIGFNIPYHPRGNDLSAVTIQLATDLLSLFFTSGPGGPHLILWDWKTGTIILNSMKPNLQLPSGIRAFELLGPRSYALFSVENHGTIYIYNIQYPHNPVIPPFCVAKLKFPELLPGIHLSSIHSHTGPFLARPRRGKIFSTAPDSRVYVISVRFLNTHVTHATLFVEHSAYMPYIQTTDIPNDPPEVPWEVWTHQKISFFPMQTATNWLRYVQGTRVLVVCGVGGTSTVTILDFNMNHGPPQDAPPQDFEIFCEPIKHVLPYKQWTVSLRSHCSSFMIEEDAVIGLKTYGTFEERIGSLEIFCMYDDPHD